MIPPTAITWGVELKQSCSQTHPFPKKLTNQKLADHIPEKYIWASPKFCFWLHLRPSALNTSLYVSVLYCAILDPNKISTKVKLPSTS